MDFFKESLKKAKILNKSFINTNAVTLRCSSKNVLPKLDQAHKKTLVP